MKQFDLREPLPEVGVTALEASAGTGKTFTLAALATRFVAELEIPLDQILLITFSRAATQELRDRVRERLVEVAAGLADPAGARARIADRADLIGVIASNAHGQALDDDEIERRRRRLLDAIAHYDSATIATTHEFCNAVLRSLGVAGDSDSREELREDISGLTDEVVADHYLQRWSGEADPPVSFRDARAAAEAAMENPQAQLRPSGLDPDSREGALVEFANGVRAEVEHRKRLGGIFTFDDMLSRLADAVKAGGSAAAERMRARWQVVLVDEFQDTDPVQWAVLHHAFAQSSRLVLIGDPKQAIYAFRGGDTPTYLAAVGTATQSRTLGFNHRSDPAVVNALQAFLRGAQLGDARIEVHKVAPAREGSTLTGGAQAGTAYHVSGGVRLRRVSRDGLPLTQSGTIAAPAWRERIAADLAADIVRQLRSGVEVTRGSEKGPLSAGDIAILLHSVKVDGPLIQAELTKRGVPWVVNSAESVMSGPAAQHWLRLLEAMEQPSQSRRINAAALTPFFTTTPQQLVDGGSTHTDEIAEKVRSWLDLWRTRGVAAVLAAAHVDGLAARVLSWQSGERLLTDLNHVGELLHRAAREDRLGLSGLLRWLRDAIDEGNRNDSRRRRLDVDEKAVQFVTIHGSKGLEYPIVYLPGLSNRKTKGDWVTTHRFHEGDQRCLDVANTAQARALAAAEDAQEDLRMAYVAMTRAKAQLVLWWAPTWGGKQASLTRLLFGRTPGQSGVPDQADFGETDAETDAVLKRWAAEGAFTLEDAVPFHADTLEAEAAPDMVAATFGRELDLAWRRTSYSGLIRAEEQRVSGLSEPEVAGTDDEDEVDDGLEPVSAPAEDHIAEELISPMDGVAAGATFGSLVHAVLELADPAAPDFGSELLRHIEEQRRWWSVPVASDDLAEALLPMNHTPLGPLAAGRTLMDIPLKDRLRELDFEIPLADGDRAGASRGRRLAAFADAIERHLPPTDPVLSYAEKLTNPSLGDQVLRGYLSGSIDAVLRVPSADGEATYVVVDYKTNTLGVPGRPLTALDYTPEKVAAAMVHSHYPLQALLYSVVLHRFLRWRLPDYDPARHLGGVLYLYVRGMVGPQTPIIDGVPCGVFSWKPPVALILELSAILDGEEPTR